MKIKCLNCNTKLNLFEVHYSKHRKEWEIMCSSCQIWFYLEHDKERLLEVKKNE